MLDIILGLGSRLLCICAFYAWIPVLIVAYIQWKMRGSPADTPPTGKSKS
ncbi:MAG: hypothetical protein K8L91_11640 [Anaerolineae bacterium]|nr:hypothetical protein [Anaerolineae bacterium]